MRNIIQTFTSAPWILAACLIAWASCVPAHADSKEGDLYILGVAIDQAGIAGGWVQLGPSAGWKDTSAAVMLNGRLYTAENAGGLWTTNPNDGQYRQIGKLEFAKTLFMFADGRLLYTIEKNGCLYRVSPHDGTWTQVGPNGNWQNTRVGAVLRQRLYTIEVGGGLWETDLQTGQRKQIGPAEYGDTTRLFAARGLLFAIDAGGNLHRVDPALGRRTPFGPPGAWHAAQAGAILANQLYTAETDGRLILTDLRDASRSQIGNADFAATRFMFGVGGKLCTIESDGNLYYVSVGKDRTIDSFDWCPQEIEKVFRERGGAFYGQLHSKMILGAAVTHTAVIDGLRWLEQSASPRDWVVIMIDAHGSTDPKEGWGIETADKLTLWGHEVKAELAKLHCQAIVIDETCESGGFAQSHPDDPPVPPNVTALCACTATQEANNQLDLAVGEALYGRADFNHDGVVDVDELVRYVKERYREWSAHPTGVEGSDTPVIVKARTLPGSFPLTKVSPALSAVIVGDDLWSALVENQEGDRYHVHLLGWSSHRGESYFLTDSVTRDFICLPGDGPPLLVEIKGQRLPARLVSENGDQCNVHLLGQNRDAQVPRGSIKYAFVGKPE